MRRRIAVAAACLLFSNAVLAEDKQTCDITKFFTHVTDNQSDYSYAFFLDQVTRENYSDVKKSIKTDATTEYGIFGANYDEFDVSRAEYFRRINFQAIQSHSREYAAAFLQPEGAKAYSECLRKGTGLTAWIEKESLISEKLTLLVKFDSAEQIDNTDLILEYQEATLVTAREGKPDERKVGSVKIGSLTIKKYPRVTLPFEFVRDRGDTGQVKDFRVTVTMRGLSDGVQRILVPAPPIITMEDRDLIVRDNGSHQWPAPTFFRSTCVKADPGWKIVKNSLVIDRKSGDPHCFSFQPGIQTEQEACFNVQLSTNQGESCSNIPWTVTGREQGLVFK